MIVTNPVLMIVLLVALLCCSAFFSGSETALMAVSRLRLRHLAETKPVRARLVERILKKPERLIGTLIRLPELRVMNRIRVTSWNELQESLFEESWNPEIGRFRSRFAFRGFSDGRYTLETTLIRLGGKFVELERHILRNFRKYAHRNVVERDSLWHWLSVAQHHGLPTRLLDWTYSPFIAAHFATANVDNFNVDGTVWAVNYVKAHELLPEKLRSQLKNEGANVFTVEMLSESVKSLKELAELSEEGFTVFFEPPSIDDRIVNQFALFSVMSKPTATLDEWLGYHPKIWRQVIIPAELKWEIRDKLDQANITERVLFPGLDGLSRWLKRQYSPKLGHPTK